MARKRDHSDSEDNDSLMIWELLNPGDDGYLSDGTEDRESILENYYLPIISKKKKPKRRRARGACKPPKKLSKGPPPPPHDIPPKTVLKKMATTNLAVPATAPKWVRRHISEDSQYVSKSVLDILHNDMNKKGDEMFLVPSCSSAPCIRWKDLLPLHPYTTCDFCSPNLVEAYCILLRKHAGNFSFNHSKSIFLSPTVSETLEKMCKMGGNESVDSVGKLMEGLAPLLEDINEETEMVFLPICVDNHWTLMVVVREDRRILYLDSRSRLNRNNLTMERMAGMVGEYICYNILDCAYHKGVWDCIKLDVPQQTQSFEGGVYMLMFMVYYASTCAIPPSYWLTFNGFEDGC